MDYFIDVYAPSRSASNQLRKFEGFIVDGPEYLTVFDGATGRELQTVRLQARPDDDGLLWGDYAMGRIEPGNRVDRFLAGVAYLDGKRPSAIFARGYYTRTTLVAYDWDGRGSRERWYVDSGCGADDQPVQRLPARPRRHRPASSGRSPRRARTRSASATWTATASRRSSTARHHRRQRQPAATARSA